MEHVAIGALWLPIIVSAVMVFLASSLIHMVLGYHANDVRKLPSEEDFAEALRKMNISPGEYAFPHPSNMKEMKSPEFQEKLKKWPGALLTIWSPGQSSMAGSLAQWFVYSIIVSIFAAYVAGRALEPGAPYLAVFRFAGATAFAGYVLGGLQESIWWKRSWSRTLKSAFDGLIYALLTAGTFGWLWPS